MAKAGKAKVGELVPADEQHGGSKIERAADAILASHRLIKFRGRLMLLIDNGGFWQYRVVSRSGFDDIAYEIMGGVGRTQVTDVYAYLSAMAPDLTDFDHYILFGVPENPATSSVTTVWDMRELATDASARPDHCVWRSPYAKIPLGIGETYERLPFIMQLAGNDPDLYDDIMQSIAPMIMEKKPDGVIWWVGDGANGKSTLMDALYRIFPKQLSSLTVKALVDERDAPNLNGRLANVVKESSEGRVDDTQIYKSIGTHEDFPVHKFNSQDTIEIEGNLHHIFSANNVPVFADKGHSARRRTFIIPFGQRFASDPLFEEKTFTPEFFGKLIMEICRYAIQLRKQGYKYKWSAATLAAKADYDSDANTAEEYAKTMISEGLVAFENFDPLYTDYERWCRENAYNPLGLKLFKQAFKLLGITRSTTRRPMAKATINIYRIGDELTDMVPMESPNPAFRSFTGLYTIPGFQKIEPEEIAVPDFEGPAPPEPEPAPEPALTPRKTILNNKW